jgi:hypothetical protein
VTATEIAAIISAIVAIILALLALRDCRRASDAETSAAEAALSHLPDLLPITGLRRGAGFNEINNSALLAKAQKPPLLA